MTLYIDIRPYSMLYSYVCAFLGFFFFLVRFFVFQSDVMKVKISRLKATFCSVSLEPHFLLYFLPFLEPGISISSIEWYTKDAQACICFGAMGFNFLIVE
jgi:hypothetical protein